MRLGAHDGAMSGPAGTQPPKLDGFEDNVKDFWASRPRRPRRGRKIAGVAAGIGDRYGIDPVIIRVVLIVATVMGGFGVFLYLLGWLFLPDERDAVSPVEALLGRGRSSMPPPMTIGLCIALIPTGSWAFGGMWLHGGGFLMLGLIAAGLYLLHRNRGGSNRPAPPPQAFEGAAPASFHAQQFDPNSVPGTQTGTETGGGTETVSAASAETGEAGPAAEQASDANAPAGWDPLGAAPLAWELPDLNPAPAPVTTPERRRKPKIGLFTVGVALITAGVGVALNLAGEPWFTPAHIVGLTLAVLGIGMVIGAFAGGGRGLILLAVPLSVAGMVLTAIPFGNFPTGGWGELDEKPLTAAEVQPSYERTGGSVRLDLTAIPASSKPIETEVLAGMGEAKVLVPQDADVTFTCESDMGMVDCLDRQREGMGASVKGRDDGGNGFNEDDQQITLNVSSRMGAVEVQRG